MAYIDLNSVRAKMAETPEDSDCTSIQERITPRFNLRETIENLTQREELYSFPLTLKPLTPFEGGIRDAEQQGILYTFEDYLSLVDITGRVVRKNKRGAINNALPPILERLNISLDIWLQNPTQFEAIYHQRFGRRRSKRAA